MNIDQIKAIEPGVQNLEDYIKHLEPGYNPYDVLASRPSGRQTLAGRI